jgi:hypothetical protein
MLEWIAVLVGVGILLAWLQPDAGMPPQRGVLDQRGRAG